MDELQSSSLVGRTVNSVLAILRTVCQYYYDAFYELWPLYMYVVYRWLLYAVNSVHRITAQLLGLPLMAAIYRVAGLLRWPLAQISLYYVQVMLQMDNTI